MPSIVAHLINSNSIVVISLLEASQRRIWSIKDTIDAKQARGTAGLGLKAD
jgi:hypothetical protein